MIHENTDLTLLDCTLRDGGYYNVWDFSPELINQYLVAMKAVQVDVKVSSDFSSMLFGAERTTVWCQ